MATRRPPPAVGVDDDSLVQESTASPGKSVSSPPPPSGQRSGSARPPNRQSPGKAGSPKVPQNTAVEHDEDHEPYLGAMSRDDVSDAKRRIRELLSEDPLRANALSDDERDMDSSVLPADVDVVAVADGANNNVFAEAPQTDCHTIKDQKSCDKLKSTCTWCAAKAVPSACYTVAEAKQLPPAVFICDGTHANFVNDVVKKATTIKRGRMTHVSGFKSEGVVEVKKAPEVVRGDFELDVTKAGTDCHTIKDQKSCDKLKSTCTWCAAKAVPSACYTVAEAKQLPPAVFICDGTHANFVNDVIEPAEEVSAKDTNVECPTDAHHVVIDENIHQCLFINNTKGVVIPASAESYCEYISEGYFGFAWPGSETPKGFTCHASSTVDTGGDNDEDSYCLVRHGDNNVSLPKGVKARCDKFATEGTFGYEWSTA